MSDIELAPQSKDAENYSNDTNETNETNETIIRRGLWLVALIVAAGIGIAGFSIASGLLVA